MRAVLEGEREGRRVAYLITPMGPLHDEAISVSRLTYSHLSSDQPSLVDINLHLPPGSRTILVGANGGPLKPLIILASFTQLPSWKIHFVANIGWEKARNGTWRRCQSQNSRRVS